ncbi:UDP-glycosyltransferase 83A1-like [Andrographis paniculata]|uniref:UDP-glycosyltransferase 83A1-like n=1 Tax=Andrographis paniculata TaxID=175694 RepID=UPI002185B76F|nr:UDP-glycosyltransferase 83A1-like [Andrographis paniculata]QDA11334.1 UDP-glycosyltransferase [Andrographis paniculata]
MNKEKRHVIVIPYPAQGHVIPMMELSQLLVSNGIKVTFVNSEHNHHRVLQSLPQSDGLHHQVDMVSIADGLEPGEDRIQLGKVTEITWRVMPVELEALINRLNLNQGDNDKINCLVADWSVGWAFQVAEKLRLRSAAFWPATAAAVAVSSTIPKLITDGVIDSDDGRILNGQTIERFFPAMPEMSSAILSLWRCYDDEATKEIIFDILRKDSILCRSAERLLCNSSPELEAAVFSQFPNIIPVGPLLASNRLANEVGHFWPQDLDCIPWLDQQPPDSVIYVAFGSYTVFDQSQFEELALGLELTNMSFLWVVRQDITPNSGNAYPAGFKERVHDRGLIVGWAPQQQVLSHPSVAIFISHCGWNSTIEGVANGVPFLCWPYFGDQFINKTYICDVWKTGLGLSREGESSIIRKGEIQDKVEHILKDRGYKERALNLQVKAMASVREGCSYKNFNSFIEWIKNN